VIVDTGDGGIGAEVFGDAASDEVDVVAAGHGEEVIAFACLGFGEDFRRATIALNYPDIEFFVNAGGAFGIVLDDGDVVGSSTKEVAEVGTDFTGSNDNDFHLNLGMSRRIK